MTGTGTVRGRGVTFVRDAAPNFGVSLFPPGDDANSIVAFFIGGAGAGSSLTPPSHASHAGLAGIVGSLDPAAAEWAASRGFIDGITAAIARPISVAATT